MNCQICNQSSRDKFCPKHLEMLELGWMINGWKKFEDCIEYISNQRIDETQARMNQTIRTGKAHGKNINNLRSYMKDGKWNYKYIK